MKAFWKTMSIFLLGVLAGIVAFFKMKKSDVTIVEGDQVGTQKVKDNSKYKLSPKERRRKRKEARILKRKQKRLP